MSLRQSSASLPFFSFRNLLNWGGNKDALVSIPEAEMLLRWDSVMLKEAYQVLGLAEPQLDRRSVGFTRRQLKIPGVTLIPRVCSTLSVVRSPNSRIAVEDEVMELINLNARIDKFRGWWLQAGYPWELSPEIQAAAGRYDLQSRVSILGTYLSYLLFMRNRANGVLPAGMAQVEVPAYTRHDRRTVIVQSYSDGRIFVRKKLTDAPISHAITYWPLLSKR